MKSRKCAQTVGEGREAVSGKPLPGGDVFPLFPRERRGIWHLAGAWVRGVGMLAHARGSSGGLAGPCLPGNFCDSFAPLAFLLLLWDGMFKTDIVKFLHPNSSPQLLGAMSPHTSRAWELPAAASHARSPDPAAGAASAQRAPLPPSPAPQPESPDVGFHPCAWSFISIKGQRSEGPRLRPPPPPAALPRGARRPGPARARAAPAGARPAENREEGAEAGRLRAVLRGGGRGGERGWGGGRGGCRDSISGGGRLRFPQSSDAGAAGLVCCRGSRTRGAR